MKERIAFVDYIRVTACFLVMLVHACEVFYNMGPVSEVANEANRLWVSVYDGFFGRISVPLFMIVSAFLLVPVRRDMTMCQFYRRRFLRILPPIVIFLVLYAVLPALWGAMTWREALEALMMVPFNFPPIAGHLWFMYPLVSLSLIIPVVSPWLEKASAKEELIFLGIFGLSTFIPWIHRFLYPEIWGECFWNGFTMLWYCSGYLGYLVMAHYIRVHLDWSRRRRAITGALCFLAGSAFTGWAFWHAGTPGILIETPKLEWAWEFCMPNVVIAAFGAFLLFSCIERKESPAFISGLSRLTFGMYLMHMFFLVPIAGLVIGGNPAEPRLPVWLAIPTIAVATYVCCALATRLLAFLPKSKWFVGC